MNEPIYYRDSLNTGICPNNIAIVKIADDGITLVNEKGIEKTFFAENREEAEAMFRCFFNWGSGHSKLISVVVD